MAEDREHFDDSQNPNQTPPQGDASRRQDDSQSDMLRPWMRTLGKKYYQNETLGKFETLDDAVDALLKRPEPKELPGSYGEKEGIEKAYKSAGLTKNEAEAISAAFKAQAELDSQKPDLKTVFGDKYDDTMADYGKGIGSFADDLKDQIGKSGLDKDPDFVRIMARVGKETGGDRFDKPRAKGDGKDPARRYVEKVYGIS